MTVPTKTPKTFARRTRSLLAVAAGVVLLPGLLVACTAAPTAEGGASGSTAATGTPFAACMREMGYDMPDPSGDDSSSMQLSVPDGVDPQQYQSDLAGCLDKTAGAGDAKMAQEAPGNDEWTRAAAKCIRDEGFSDYPDDEAAKMRYQPADQDAFDEIARECETKAAGAAETSVAP